MRLLPTGLRVLAALVLLLGAAPAHAQTPDTLLLRAARAGDLPALRAALAAGARATAADTAHASALMLATVGGHAAVATALLDAGADCAAPAFYRPGRTGFYGSLLAAAAAEGHLPLFKTLAARCRLDPDAPERDRDGAPGWTPLQSAAANDRLDVVQYLVSRGASLRGTAPATPLDLAQGRGADRVALWLMQRGAPSARSREAQLIAAAESGAAGTVRALLDAGARLEATADDGSTAFQRALGAGHLALADTLAARGANLRHVDRDGWTSLHYAAATDAGARYVPRLVGLGLAVDARAGDGSTPLAVALLKGHLAPTRALLAAGAAPATVASDGWTALHIAARDGASGLVDTLLAARVPVSPRTNDGWTPLGLTANTGLGTDIAAAALVCAGASPQETVPDGRAAADAAPDGLPVRAVLRLAARSGCAGVRPFLALSGELRRATVATTDPDTAVALLRQGDARLQRIFGRAPELVTTRLMLAQLLTQRGRADVALGVLDDIAADSARLSDGLVRGLLFNRANTLGALGRSREAVAAQRALLARERADPTVGPTDRALTEQALAKLLTEAGETGEALALARAVLATFLEHDGPEAQGTHLAALSLAMGLFNTSLWDELGRHADAWREPVTRQNDDLRAGWSTIYGILALQRGAYAEAEAHYRSALDARRRLYGDASLDVLRSLRDLVELFRVQQRYADARPLVDEGLATVERLVASGQHDPFLVVFMRDVTTLLAGQNDLAAAEAAGRRTLALATRTSGAETVFAADAHQVLGDVFLRQNRLADARASYRRALALYDARATPDYLARLTTLGSLAELERRSGNAEAALSMFEDAIARLERSHPNDPSLATLYNNRSLARIAGGDRSSADADLEQAIARTRASETGQANLVPLLVNAAAQRRTRDPARARRHIFEAAHLASEQIDTVLPALSIAEQQRYLETDLAALTTVLVGLTRGRAAADTAYRFIARTKGLLLRSLRQQVDLARRPGLQAEALALADARRALAAHLRGRPPAAGDTAAAGAWQRRLAWLVDRRERAERLLTRDRGGAALADPLGVGSDVRTFLRDGEALVDLYRVAAAPEDPARPDYRYVAAYVVPGRPVRLREIGRADTLDRLVDRWREAVRRGGTAAAERRELDKRFWWRLVGSLPEGTRRLWLSPDGQLARLPFDVWATNPRHPFALAVVDSPRDLAALRSAAPGRSTGTARADGPDRLLLVGDVAFGGDGRPFAPLPGTRAEIDAVRGLFRTAHTAAPAVVLRGDDATGDRVLAQLPGARYVHLATHGTFAATPPGDYAATRTVKPFSGARRTTESDTRMPLLESGLAFAGANVVDAAPTATLSRREAFVTAEEFVGVDLSGARLVVLSACETGRGREITGQGVMGLRASFATAGARTLVMSLWPVPDAATARLMETFYDGLWRQRLPVGEALRRAQADVRTAFPAPVNWAAWVLAGEAW